MTLMQEVFAKEYLLDLNATRAAVRAGYSFKTARAIGSENLTKPDIQEVIRYQMAERSLRLQVNIDDVVRELSAIAFFDIFDVAIFDAEGLRLRPFDEISKEKLRGLRFFSSASGQIKFSTYNKVRALFLLGQHLGMFKK